MDIQSGEVLDRLRSAFGAASDAALSRVLGRSNRTNVAYWRKNNTIPLDIFVQAHDFGLSIDWLLFGSGADSNSGEPLKTLSMPADNRNSGGGEGDLCTVGFNDRFLVEMGLDAHDPKDMGLLRIAGDGMAPTLQEGDIVIYLKSATKINTNGLYVLKIGDSEQVRRVSVALTGGVSIGCDNERYAKEALGAADAAQLPVVGRVVWQLTKCT